MIYLIHIHRTGGSTFKAILRNNFGTSVIFINDPKRANAEFTLEEYIEIFKKYKHLKAIESHHIRYPLPNGFSQSVEPVFIIRSPFERFISNYFYLQQIAGPSHYANQDIESFYKYVKENHSPDVRYINGQTFHIAREINLNKAKDIVDSSYLVGTTELFDEFLLTFQNLIGYKFNIFYERRNTGIVKKGQKDKINEIKESDFYEMFMDENKIDLELHQYATNKLKNKNKSIPGFDLMLQQFRIKNKNYKYPFFRTKITSLISRTSLKLKGLAF